jgi:NitT/TauT family transport system substrate-binding protein
MRAVLATMIGALVSACGLVGEGPPPGDLVTLRSYRQPTPSFAPLFIAEEEGFFREQGLSVEGVPLKRSADALPAVMQGELDIAGDFLGAGYLNAMARGAPVRYVADKGYIAPTGCCAHGLVVARGPAARGDVTHLTGLRGRTISVNPRSSSAYLLDRLLATAALTLDDVELVDIPLQSMEQAVGRSIDAAFMMEPAISRVVQEGRGSVLATPMEASPDFQLAYILFGPNLLTKNPDAGRRFMVAYVKAVRQLNLGKTARNVEILMKHTGQSRELLMQACWPSFRDDGRINLQSIPDYQAWALERGLVDTLLTADEFWDGRFVEHANRVLGTPQSD